MKDFMQALLEAMADESQDSATALDGAQASDTLQETLQKTLEPVERQCRMCQCTYRGFRLICDAPDCLRAWQDHLREVDKRYRTNVTGYWGHEAPFIVSTLPSEEKEKT